MLIRCCPEERHLTLSAQWRDDNAQARLELQYLLDFPYHHDLTLARQPGHILRLQEEAVLADLQGYQRPEEELPTLASPLGVARQLGGSIDRQCHDGVGRLYCSSQQDLVVIDGLCIFQCSHNDRRDALRWGQALWWYG